MKTELVEFKNNGNDILRGVYTFPENNSSHNCVICLSGFERAATTEKKFKRVADEISRNLMPVLRLDFTGCGLSDGDFKNTTLNSLTEDFAGAVQYLEESGVNKFSIVAHSLGCLVVANYVEQMKNKIEKIVLLSPALNQKDLLRYWFVVNKMKKEKPSIEITWDNYKQYLNEDEFLEDCRKSDKTTKANFINADYFLECQNVDLSDNFRTSLLLSPRRSLSAEDCDEKARKSLESSAERLQRSESEEVLNFKLFSDKILHIHGDKDIIVPLESVGVNFSNQIIVEDGDHDLEKPAQMKQWLEKTVNFFK